MLCFTKYYATADEIGATGSSYTGNAGLGGFGLGFGKIDTRPLDDLAHYTFLYNKSEYDQRQKDMEAKAKELSQSLSYDLTSSIPKDAKVLQDKYNGLVDYLRNNPDAVDYRNQEKWLKLKTMRNDIENDIQSAGVRNLMNVARQNEIDGTTAPELKDYLQNKLDQEVQATDIRTPLRHSAKYDIAPVAATAAPVRKFGVTDIGRNIIGEAEWNVLDQSALNNMANTLATGLANSSDFARQPWFQQLPPQVQARYIDQYNAQRASGKLEPVKSAENFNAAIQSTPGFFIDTPQGKKVDMNAVLNSDNTLVRGVAEQINAYNKYVDQMTKYIKAGYFKDDFSGESIQFGNDASGVRESDYKKIDLTDGLQPEELLKMRIYAASNANPTRNIKTTNTDNDLQYRNLSARLAELGLNKEKFDYSKSSSFIGADAVIREVTDKVNEGQPYVIRRNGKDEHVKLIADPDLIKEFDAIDKDGNVVNRADHVIFNPETNQMTLVYLKNAPYKTTEDFKTGTKTKEFTDPAHVDINGKMLNRKGEPIVEKEIPLNATEWMGKIVNRKFSKDDAGAVNNLIDDIYTKNGRSIKKLAKFYTGGATTTTDTKTQASGSTTELSQNPADWKKVGNNWQYKDGTLYNDKGEVVNQ